MSNLYALGLYWKHIPYFGNKFGDSEATDTQVGAPRELWLANLLLWTSIIINYKLTDGFENFMSIVNFLLNSLTWPVLVFILLDRLIYDEVFRPLLWIFAGETEEQT